MMKSGIKKAFGNRGLFNAVKGKVQVIQADKGTFRIPALLSGAC